MPKAVPAPLRKLFEKRLAAARLLQPDLRAILTIGRASEFPARRDYAYSAWDGKKARITFAPKVARAPRAQQDALIRHELSHAFLQHAGLPHSERDCDAVAEQLFGNATDYEEIYYDAEDIQTLDAEAPEAERPRPSYLPK